MRSAFIATLIVTAGILLLIGFLLSGQVQSGDMDSPESLKDGGGKAKEAALTADFEYLKECRKYVMKDFLARDIFEKNKDKLQANAVPMVIATGHKLEKLLEEMAEADLLSEYALVLEGNLNNEWESRFDRNNTWAYQLSYNRALAVYKLWLKNGINIRKYPVETLVTGGGYYGLCPQKSPDSRRFSVQLIHRHEPLKPLSAELPE